MAGIDFKINVGFDSPDKAIDKTTEKLDEMGKAADKAADKLDDIGDSAESTSQSVDELNGKIDETNELLDETKNKAEEADKGVSHIGKDTTSQQTLRSQLKQTTNELQMLTFEYSNLSESEKKGAYGQELLNKMNALNKQAGALRDTMDDVNESIKNVASDTSKFDAFAQGVNVATSSVGLLTGSMEMLGIAEEDIQDIQAKLQASLAISNSLTVIQAAVQKQSAVMLGINAIQTTAAAKAAAYKRLIDIKGTAATTAATIAQRAFNVVANANPYVLLATAVLTVVSALYGFTKLTKQSTELEKEHSKELEKQKKYYQDYQNAVATSTGKIELAFSKLQKEWKKLQSTSEKIDWINTNKSALEQLGLSIKSVNDADTVFVKQSDSVIKALKARAKAKALETLYEDEYLKAYKKNYEADHSVKGGGYHKVAKKGSVVSNEEAIAAGLNASEIKRNGLISSEYVLNTKSAVDKINAYRSQEAVKTNKKIHDENSKFVDQIEKDWLDAEENASQLAEGIKQVSDSGSGIDTQTTKVAEKAEDRTKELERAKKEYADAKENLEKEASQAEIDKQKESAEKAKNQITLDYNNRIAEIEKKKKEYLEKKQAVEGSDAKLSKQEEDAFSQLYAANDEAYKRSLDSISNADKAAQRDYLEQYGSYQEQRLAIAEKYDAEIAATDSEWTKKSLEMQKQAALQQADFNSFKKNPKFALAFDSPDNASIETLKTLIQEFTNRANQGQLQGLNLEELKVWFDAANQMYDSLAQRDPFAALKESSKQLADAQNKLTSAVAKLNKAKADATKNIKLEVDSNGKLVKVEQDLTQLEAEVAQAENEVAQARSKQQKATQQATAKIDELASAISNLGNAIGGEEGEILDCIAQTMNFTTSTINSIQELATISASSISTTMKAIESASVILAIVGVAIQLMQQLSKLVGDSHKQYEEFAEKQAVINDLTTSVNDYKIAVAEAAKAEKTWFASSNGSNLREQWKVSENALESYNKKYNETQAKYVNESGGGWLTKAWSGLTSAVNWINSSASKLLGLGDVLGDFQSLSFDPLTNGINAALDSAVEKAEDFNGSMVKAFQNLRIETQAATKGFWGTGIGAKSQKTEDLTTWVKENYGEDLFRKDGMINSTLVTQIIEEQGDKLVGETKKTLEKLQEYTDKYDEFKEQLKESVSQLYSPLADDLTDALWEWYKEGTDVMDKFHEYAADTFESIAKDAIKSAVLTKLFDGYKDKIADLYEQYSYSNIDETQLMNAVSAETTALTSQVEAALPTLQAMTKSVGDAIAAAGYASDSSSQISASQRSVASMSEDAASELNGRFTALQISGNSIDTNLKLLALELKNDAKETHSYLKKIVSETEDFNDTQSDEPNVNVNVEAPQVNVNVEPNINVEPTQVTVEAPQVNVEAPQVTVETDTTELNNIIQQVNSAITSLALSAGNNTSILTSINSTMESAVSAITSVQMSISEGNTMLANINASVLACNGTLNAIYNTNDSGFRTLQQEIRAVASAINNKL